MLLGKQQLNRLLLLRCSLLLLALCLPLLLRVRCPREKLLSTLMLLLLLLWMLFVLLLLLDVDCILVVEPFLIVSLGWRLRVQFCLEALGYPGNESDPQE